MQLFQVKGANSRSEITISGSIFRRVINQLGKAARKTCFLQDILLQKLYNRKLLLYRLRIFSRFESQEW